jgi:microcystin-dependent protein
LYANNYQLAIISKETFTPKSTVVGFTTINQGFNLSSVDSANTASLSRIWGTASNADALLVTGVSVPSANFLRSDTSSTSNFPLTIRADGGLTIGSNSSFNIGRDGTSTVLYSKSSGDSVDFKLNNNSIPVTVLHLNALSRVGIGSNNTAPTATLDIAGTVTASGDLSVTSTTDSTSLITGSIKTAGGIAVSKNIRVGKDVTINGKLYLNTLDPITGLETPGSVILPSSTGIFDIGSSIAKFRNVYADSFVGDFSGTFTGTLQGSISGSAARLASPTTFSMTGDVSSDNISFTGQSSLGTATFTTTINQNFITNKPSVDDSFLSDQLLVYRNGSANLVKMTKETLLMHVATVPIGVIMPFAGTIVPEGYLLCDGSEVKTADYPELYGVIGYTYRSATLLSGAATFSLPDLRGRFPLGRDNMDNGQRIPSRDDASILIDAGGGPANRVTDVTADIVGTGAGAQTVTLSINNLPDHTHNLSSTSAQYYAAGLPSGISDTAAVPGLGLPNSSTGSGLPNSGGIISSTLGSAVTIMNPYTTINYIIFTGVL